MKIKLVFTCKFYASFNIEDMCFLVTNRLVVSSEAQSLIVVVPESPDSFHSIF